MSSDSAHEPRKFITCPSCGMLTPNGVVQCVECGEPIASLVAAAAEERNERHFAESVLGRETPATWIIIGINVGIFVLMFIAAGSINPGTPSYQETLVNFGAKLNSSVDAGQYWRLVTPVFLHIGLPHLFVNMYSLYILGPLVERLFGTSRFVVMYLLAGIGGVLGSYGLDKLAAHGDGVSAGASGALFGLMGILLVFGLRRRNELPGVFKEAYSPRTFLPILLLNLVITFAVPFIDKGAHIGGLIVGGLLGYVVPFARPGERRAGFLWWATASLAVIVVVASFALAYRHASPLADINRFMVAYNDSNAPVLQSAEAVGRAADKSAVAASATSDFAAAAAAIDASAGVDEKSRELLWERKVLLERAAALLGDQRGDLTPDVAVQYSREVETHMKAWDVWLEQNGPRFRLVKKEEDTNTSGGNDGN